MRFKTLTLVAAGLLLSLMASRAQALSISAQSISPTTISFETAGPSDTTISFTLDAAADVTVTVLDLTTNATVATINQNYTSAGAKTIVWNALWLIGNDLGRTNHNFEVSIFATDGSASDTKTVLTPLLIRSVDIHNVTVTPSFDANHNPTFPFLFQYQLAKDAEVTLTVSNSSGSVVRNLLTSKLQVNESISSNTVTWNGLADDGRSVAVGLYTLTIDARDPSNNDQATQRTRTFAVTSLAGSSSDAQTVFEQNVFVYPNPVRNGQGIFQYAAIHDNATVTLRVYTISGDLVLDKTFHNLTAGNVNTYVWDATNQSGRKVGRGLYFYVVREHGPEGTLQVTKKMVVLP